ncbi:MAG: asparagine synthase (glutamine-hydrolyzing) [Thermodesulfobacteriota bacterium]
MCGIVGIARWLHNDVQAHLVCSMRDVATYRGPDDKGCWVDEEHAIGLGHRRLSILDPTASGQQPMHFDGLSIVYNGEVYNYLEIRAELKKIGHVFKTGTDTEVILKAYRQWGRNCLSYFNGMFAIAIWDSQRRELFLARDRLGVKPFYYYENENSFYFASEVKAILAALPESPAMQENLIDSYMSFGYIPGEQTLHKGIKRLLPGHLMVVSAKKCVTERYWDVHFENNKDKGEAYYWEKCSSLLNDAIDLRLRSDVPLGVFLSGGIDSSAVVGLLAPRVDEPLKTFSVAYDFGRQFDETKYARMVAEKFQTDHHEIFVKPQQFLDFVPEFIRLMDEPVTEAAAISLYYVSKLAKEKVTVVLSGEGSDEIFGGYDLYRYMGLLEKYHGLVGKSIGKKIEELFLSLVPTGSKIAKYISLGSLPLEERYKGISTYEESNKEKLYTKDFAHFCERHGQDVEQKEFLDRLFAATEGLDCLSRMLYFDTKTWLVDDLLIKADRMSMAASLELRVPFLDYRLVEFAAKVPSRYKVRNSQGKYILKRMMESVLPREIIHRQKMGFPTPLKMMFENELYEYTRDVLLSEAAYIGTYFKKERMKLLLEEHLSQKMDHHRLLWQLLVLELWLQHNKFIGSKLT